LQRRGRNAFFLRDPGELRLKQPTDTCFIESHMDCAVAEVTPNGYATVVSMKRRAHGVANPS
jgi:hypothetical protein